MTYSPEKSLSPEHAQLLAASAISSEVAAARGYRTVTRQADLKQCGFGENQRQTPTLLIPIYHAGGEIALYHHRPDQPRIRDGKPAKYEFPTGSRMAVDAHPSLKEKVRDPSLPLIITEGVKKADAAISVGLCCIAVIGTWNWRGTNEWGGKTALPDWDSIAFKDKNNAPRQVYIAYDSDVMLKASVYLALSRLSAFLKQKGASVAYLYLPHGADGRKVGLDDYLAAGHSPADLLALATPTLRPPPQEENAERELPYRETPSGLVYLKPTQSGPVQTPLTNFTARITADVQEDDGAQTRRFFEMEARRGQRTFPFSVPSSAFSAMNWPMEHLGAGAIVYPGFGTKEHARTAIQMLSNEPPVTQVYSHTGWREVAPGQWAYLHSGGAIGAAQPVQVRLSPALAGFCLPEPPTGDALIQAITASLGLWDLMPDYLSVPLFCAVYRAALGTCDFSLHLAGPSGAFKSEIAALCQQHFGAGLDARHLPGAWSSTDNALEGLAFTLKDALCVLDDFAPTGTAMDVSKLHAKADRVLRGQGNNAGRGRMNADGTLRTTKYPRGLLLSTGEDVPAGLSLRARMLVLEIGPRAVAPECLTCGQQAAAAGRYAQALSGFVAWLAPRYTDVQAGLKQRITALREHALASGQHRRTPEMTANLGAALELFLEFAQEAGAITPGARECLWQRGWNALGLSAQAQATHQAASEPTGRYLELLVAALASGRAHLAGPDGDTPDRPEAWGWRAVTIGAGENERTEWRPQGERVGWQDGEAVYLEPDAAHAAARRMGESGGDGLTLSPRTLHIRLHERGLLVSVSDTRQTLTIRKVLGGQRRTVLHLRAESLGAEPSPLAKPAQPAQTDPPSLDTPYLNGRNGQVGQVTTPEEREIWRP